MNFKSTKGKGNSLSFLTFFIHSPLVGHRKHRARRAVEKSKRRVGRNHPEPVESNQVEDIPVDEVDLDQK